MLRVGTLGGVNGSVVLLESGKSMHKRLFRILFQIIMDCLRDPVLLITKLLPWTCRGNTGEGGHPHSHEKGSKTRKDSTAHYHSVRCFSPPPNF